MLQEAYNFSRRLLYGKNRNRETILPVSSRAHFNKRLHRGYLSFIHESRFRTLVNWCILLIFAFFSFNMIFSTIFTPFSQHSSHNYSQTNIDPISLNTEATKSTPIIQIKEEVQLKPNIYQEKPVYVHPPEKEKPKEIQSKETEKRRNKIRDAFKHAIGGYLKHGFPSDEIRPVTNETNWSWGGFGITMFDSLDTMLLMELTEEYEKCLEQVLSVNFEKDHDASLFEFTIRYVGGLLGAYEMTGRKDFRLVTKAKEMADRLIIAFESETGIPYGIVNLKTGKRRNSSWTSGSSILAEIGSVQLEFSHLSYLTGDPMYEKKANRVMEILNEMNPEDGLYPVYINPNKATFSNDLVSFGGLGDSFYEYLLKLYILLGKTEESEFLRKMYEKSMDGMTKNMIGYSSQNRTFLGEFKINSKHLLPEMDHLVCYVPGMLALGAEGAKKDFHLQIAKDLLDTCLFLYFSQSTGIGPERTHFIQTPLPKGQNLHDFKALSTRYLLRPGSSFEYCNISTETVESVFVLYRITHNETYRELGWKIFESIEKYCKTKSAYSGLLDVNIKLEDEDDEEEAIVKNWNNSMQSFFLAETLKYLFLLFSDESIIPLDEFVFTTEAHPLRIRKIK